MVDSELDAKLNKKIVESLNHILELELAGVVRYMHYSFMIFGHNRIPIVAWLREQATESSAHAVLAGEHITALGGHPSLKIGSLLETHQHDVNEILKEAHEHEKEGLDAYYSLLELVAGKSVVARGICARPDRGRGNAPGGHPQDDAQARLHQVSLAIRRFRVAFQEA